MTDTEARTFTELLISGRDRCEWPNCGARHETIILRRKSNPEEWVFPGGGADIEFDACEVILNTVYDSNGEVILYCQYHESKDDKIKQRTWFKVRDTRRERAYFRVCVFKEGDVYVAICPKLNVSSFGDDVESAKQSLQEAVEAFLETCDEMGTQKDVLGQYEPNE